MIRTNLHLITLSVTMMISNVALAQEQNGEERKIREFVTSNPMVHDPVMAKEDGVYHIFATGMGIQRMTSKDRKNWQVKAMPVMTVIPKWTRDSVPGFDKHVWAPDIIRWHNKWWLAYSSILLYGTTRDVSSPHARTATTGMPSTRTLSSTTTTRHGWCGARFGMEYR